MTDRRPIDVVVASVGRRDVRSLPSTGVSQPPPRWEHYQWPDPITGDSGFDVRSYATRASSWLRHQADPAGAAARVDLPLLDPILAHVAQRQPEQPPALVLVTSDQTDPEFKPGDTVQLGGFIKEVLEARRKRAVRRVEVFAVKANPTRILDVWHKIRPLVGIVAEATDRAVPYVAISATGGTPALSTALVVLFAAVAKGRLDSDRARWEIGELVLCGTPSHPQVSSIGPAALLLEEVDW